MAKRNLAKSHIVVRARANRRIENVRIVTAVRKSDGTIRRKTIRYRKADDAYPIRMVPGIHPFMVSAPFFLDDADSVPFEVGVLHTKVFHLQLKKEPVFRPFAELASKTKDIFARSAAKAGAPSGERYYERLGPIGKAASLNILAKMAKTPVIERRKIVHYIDYIYKYRPDRFYARLNEGRSLFEDIVRSRERKRQPIFSPASGALHKGFDAASFKTREEDLMGNLQLSLSSRGKARVNVDADIDIYSELLFHLFGEVFWNSLTGLTTSPFKVYKVLLKDEIEPEYSIK